MLLLKNYPSRRSSSAFQPRRRIRDAYNRRRLSSSSSSSSESSGSESEEEIPYKPVKNVIASDSDVESESEPEDLIPIKGKLYKRNNEKLQRYFTPGTGREVIENLVPRSKQSQPYQRGSLDSQQLDVKKIEYRKKIDIVWNSIISKYSAYDEDDQGDIINLQDFSIEEDTGHIEKLQNFQRTNIWNDINEFENVHGEGYDYDDEVDPSEDPINLLTTGKPSREQSKRSTPPSTVMLPPRLPKAITSVASTDKKPRAELNNDPLSLLTPKKSSKLSTRSSSPSRKQTSERTPKGLGSNLEERIYTSKQSSLERRLESTTSEEGRSKSSIRPPSPSISSTQSPSSPPVIDLTNDPISLLTPQKTSRIPTRESSPQRNSKSQQEQQSQIAEPSSPLYSLASPSSRSKSRVSHYQQSQSPHRSTVSGFKSNDPTALLSPKPTRRITKPPTPPSSTHGSDRMDRIKKYPITAIPLDQLNRPYLNEYQTPSKRIKGRFERSGEKRCHDLVKNGSGARHSSPVRRLMASFALAASHNSSVPVSRSANKNSTTPSPKFKGSNQHKSSTIKEIRNELISLKPNNMDPINLLTPSATSRIGSKRPTRSSSPLRARRTPLPTTGQNESDPICLLTPRSSSKRSTPRRNPHSHSSSRSSSSRSYLHHETSCQEYPDSQTYNGNHHGHQKEQQILPPPPSFNLPSSSNTMSKIAEEEEGSSPFISQPFSNTSVPPSMLSNIDMATDRYEHSNPHSYPRHHQQYAQPVPPPPPPTTTFAPYPYPMMMYPTMMPTIPFPPQYGYLMDPTMMNFPMNANYPYTNQNIAGYMNQESIYQRFVEQQGYPPINSFREDSSVQVNDDYTHWRNEHNKRSRITQLDHDPIDLLTRS